jgi:hypothetical protein
MAMDFDMLVLLPCEDTFGASVNISPDVSIPGAPAYAARGIFHSVPVDVTMLDGQIFSDQQSTLGIRLSEFAVSPAIGDRLTITDPLLKLQDVTFWIAEMDTDGQGGALLLLRRTAPPAAPVFS